MSSVELKFCRWAMLGDTHKPPRRSNRHCFEYKIAASQRALFAYAERMQT